METITYKWGIGTSNHTLELVYVPGTSGAPCAFGNGDAVRSIELPGFFIQTTPVTQALWIHVLGTDANPSIHQGVDFPVENVSWESITRPGGFLDRINQSVVRQAISHRAAVSSCAFRLSTETETNFPTLNALHGTGCRLAALFSVDLDPRRIPDVPLPMTTITR